ncbi:MAG: amidohydrolase [Dehalococcoidales bacterium]|nr:amidohydrolase [Dehalococcoidales bacterium]
MPQADLILKNVRILTLDPKKPVADLLAVKDGRILYVGNAGDLASFQSPGTRIIDCENRTVVPGFNDAHCHIFSFLRKLISVDLSPDSVKSIPDIKQAIKEKAENTPRGEWITGTDYNDFYLPERRHPTRWEIDEVAPYHPVVLSHRSLHACVLNSRALELAGIGNETEEPPGGVIKRDLETGQPDGLLIDMLGYIREQVMPHMTDEETERGMGLVSRHCLSLGITSLQDATVVNDYNRWQKFQRFIGNGVMQPRVYMMVGHEHLDEFIQAGLHFGSGDERLRLGGVKITPSETAQNGMFPPPEELNRMVLAIHKAGFRVAVHAIRYETIEAVVKAIELALEQLPVPDHRHRIEHCSECPDSLLERIAKTGINIATQPPFLYYSGERYLATVPKDRQPWLYRIKSMLDAGITVAGSSDSPIVDNAPLMGIHSAVNRLAETGQEVILEEKITPVQALALYTSNAARLSFEEAIKGTIEEGKLADLAILSHDPTSLPPEQIKDIKVEMTILGGKVVWG